MARAPRTRLNRVVEVAGELLVVTNALNKLRQGQNGSAITAIADVLEKEARNAATLLIRKRRAAKRQPRAASGQFTNGHR